MAIGSESESDLDRVKLVESDGIPLESPWHVAAISLLIEVFTWHWRSRTDFYVGGNMFIYFSLQRSRQRDYRGPDFFFVEGISRFPPRPYWAVWEEGDRYPNLIVEFLSPTTAAEDRTTKKRLYERTFRTPEYFCYDPETQELEGWRLGAKGRYRAIKPDKRGWMWSEQLKMWLGNWEGTFHGMKEVWLRPYDADGQLIPLEAEAAQQQAEAAQQQADAERAQREALQEELARLRAELAELKGKGKR